MSIYKKYSTIHMVATKSFKTFVKVYKIKISFINL
jgi:hypothetical protein